MFFDMHMAVEWHLHWSAKDNEVDFEVLSLYSHNAIGYLKELNVYAITFGTQVL